jgi:hypothetical protein
MTDAVKNAGVNVESELRRSFFFLALTVTLAFIITMGVGQLGKGVNFKEALP